MCGARRHSALPLTGVNKIAILTVSGEELVRVHVVLARHNRNTKLVALRNEPV